MAKWYVSAKKADFAAIGAKFGIDQVTARIIRNRGVIGDDAVNEFLNGKISDIADPVLLKDGQRLVDILAQKIADKAKIRIIGDYDIDGVMSTIIMSPSPCCMALCTLFLRRSSSLGCTASLSTTTSMLWFL